MWNLEKLLSVLVASEKSLGECQNYATTLWEAGSKGKLCYQHPAAWQKTKTGQKLHQNLIPMKSEWGWFGKNPPRWNIYFGKMDRYIWPGAQLWWRLPFAFTSASPPQSCPPKKNGQYFWNPILWLWGGRLGRQMASSFQITPSNGTFSNYRFACIFWL